MFFSELIDRYRWSDFVDEVASKTPLDVEQALNQAAKGEQIGLDEFKALISSSASKGEYLEAMARFSQKATLKRFGKTIQLYIPLYMSNECINHCIYCGFNHENNFKRVVLSDEEILAEAKVLKEMGYDNVLLLTGESPLRVGVDYIEHAMQLLEPMFSQISLEVQPLKAEEYARLRKSSLYAVYVYQETYNRERYAYYHPAGIKKDFDWRINTHDRLGQARVHKIGIGALLGLEDWRAEAVAMALHLRHLQKNYWMSKYSISFPRMRPHEGGFQPQFPLSDRDFAQMIWAFRLFDHDLEMSLTTRESRLFRNNMIPLGVTSISAGSKTDPGGYSMPNKEVPQFEINDDRSPQEMKKVIESLGYEVVWKDWDRVYR